jgi:hypothetical protein
MCPGPCVMCGKTNYPLSMGGPSVCPMCDCGHSTSQSHLRKLTEENEQLRQEYRKCKCVYESECHGIEMIKSPSGEENAVGGTDTMDRWKFCPWCGGSICQ